MTSDSPIHEGRKRPPGAAVVEPSPFTLTDLRGVRAAGVRAGIKASGNPDVALLVTDGPVPCAGVFTQNLLAAAPIIVCREHLQRSGGLLRALVVNSGCANACTGERGLADARAMCQQVAAALRCPEEQVLVCSTGVIGQRLPMDRVHSGIAAAMRALSTAPEAGRRFLQAIMTTDAFPKEAAGQLSLGSETATIAGVCKGAGMIHPNMATMLAFLGMDLAMDQAALQEALPRIAARSFNAVHVDSHPSTNDTLLLFATGHSGRNPPAPSTWIADVTRVARRLSWLIARDGEGATKVTTITIRGAQSDEAARAVASHVALSALVRTALFGNDPNWGRFVSQVGNCAAVRSVAGLRCELQGITVFADGEPTAFDRKAASQAMATEDVQLTLILTEGSGEAELMTSDLGYRYVEVNAEYTT